MRNYTGWGILQNYTFECLNGFIVARNYCKKIDKILCRLGLVKSLSKLLVFVCYEIITVKKKQYIQSAIVQGLTEILKVLTEHYVQTTHFQRNVCCYETYLQSFLLFFAEHCLMKAHNKLTVTFRPVQTLC